MPRLFVGIPVSMRTVEGLAAAAETLARRAQQAKVPVRWLAPAGYHLTVKFLGACRPEVVGAVSDALDAATAGVEPFRMSAARLGAFPSTKKASVVWAGIDDAGGKLAALVERVERSMEEIGFPRERRRFHGHVTIGRLREPADVADVLLPLSEQLFSETNVQELLLFESLTKPTGSEYSVVARSRLGRPKRQPGRVERFTAGDTSAAESNPEDPDDG